MGFLAKALGLQTLSATAPEVDGPVGDYSTDVTPPSRAAGGRVSTDRAVSIPSAFRAVQLISAIGSSLELYAVRAGKRLPLADTPLVRQPDPWRPRRSFVARYLVNAATDGNNFLLKHRGADGSVASGGVELLNPFATYVRWETRGGRRVKLYDSVDPRTGKARTYTDEDVLHVWSGLEVPGHDRALGPIEACRYALTGILDTRDYASGWFGGELDDVPSGILTSDQRLDPATGAYYRKVWHNPQGLDADGKPLPRVHNGPSVRVLGQGLKYEPTLLKPADAQWLESQGFGVLEIARMFGIPAEYLEAAVDGSSLVYSSLPMLATRFTSTTLFPVYLAPLEAALSELLPRGQEARFSAEELTRPDAKTRAEIDRTYLELGVYGGEYVRTRDGIEAPAGTPIAPAQRPAGVPA